VLFPKWMNTVPTVVAMGKGGGVFVAIVAIWYYATPTYWKVGYMPRQPGSGFNHQIHAGKLGIDCRYCHTHVEESPEANVPNVAVCYGCHATGRVSTRFASNDRTEYIRTAYENDEPIEWRRVHKLPDYVRNFPHHVHVKAGVSCLSCHGQIMSMPEVYQAESLSMGWCLDCHRAPEKHMVDPGMVTQLTKVEAEFDRRRGMSREELRALSREQIDALHRAPPENCAACHH